MTTGGFGIIDLSWWQVVLALLLVIVIAIVSLRQRLGLERDLLIGTVRTVVQLYLVGWGIGRGHVEAGRIRALAVASPQRVASIPLPTAIEAGVADYVASNWWGLAAPQGTPQPVLDKLHTETVKVLAMHDVRSKLESLGLQLVGNTPAEFSGLIAKETASWAKVIKDAGIKAGE